MQENWCSYWQDSLKLGCLLLRIKYLRKVLILINISGDCPNCKIIWPLYVYCLILGHFTTCTLLQMVFVTEMLHNYRHVIHYRINSMLDRVCFSNYCYFAYLHKLSSISTSMWWSRSSEEWHIFVCPCPSKWVLFASETLGLWLFIARTEW